MQLEYCAGCWQRAAVKQREAATTPLPVIHTNQVDAVLGKRNVVNATPKAECVCVCACVQVLTESLVFHVYKNQTELVQGTNKAVQIEGVLEEARSRAHAARACLADGLHDADANLQVSMLHRRGSHFWAQADVAGRVAALLDAQAAIRCAAPPTAGLSV